MGKTGDNIIFVFSIWLVMCIFLYSISFCQIIPNKDITYSINACEVNGGVNYIEYNFISFNRVVCNNEAEFDVNLD